jgi:hypothetical protein
MRYAVTIFLIILLSLSSLSCSTAKNGAHVDLRGSASDTSTTKSTTTGQKKWEPIFFRIINERLQGTDIKNLRDQEISSDSKEIRIWSGFDLYPLKGIILKQSGVDWSARYLPPLDDLPNTQKSSYFLPPPKSGWKKLWEKLESLDIISLPDATDIGANNPSPDVGAVVVEIKTSDGYRTYKYDGLEASEHPEAKKMVKICKILSDEFKIQLC